MEGKNTNQIMPATWLEGHAFLTEKQLDLARIACVKLLQIHAYYPCLGSYYVPNRSWKPGWVWESTGKKQGVDLSRSELHDLVSENSDLGPALYVNVSTCQKELALKFKGSLVMYNKSPVPGWNPGAESENSFLMRPSGSFGKYLLEQVNSLLEAYPANIFADRCDYAANAGSVEEFIGKAANLCHEKNRLLVVNVPSSKKIAQLADIVTADCQPGQMGQYHKRALEKPLFFLELYGQKSWIPLKDWISLCDKYLAGPGFRIHEYGEYKAKLLAEWAKAWPKKPNP